MTTRRMKLDEEPDPLRGYWRSISGTVRPGRRFRFKKERTPGDECLAKPTDHEARIAAEAERVSREDVGGAEPLTCWGCGATLPRGSWLRKHGWYSRKVTLGPGITDEVHCPTCWGRWGWVEPAAAPGTPNG